MLINIKAIKPLARFSIVNSMIDFFFKTWLYQLINSNTGHVRSVFLNHCASNTSALWNDVTCGVKIYPISINWCKKIFSVLLWIDCALNGNDVYFPPSSDLNRFDSERLWINYMYFERISEKRVWRSALNLEMLLWWGCRMCHLSSWWKAPCPLSVHLALLSLNLLLPRHLRVLTSSSRVSRWTWQFLRWPKNKEQVGNHWLWDYLWQLPVAKDTANQLQENISRNMRAPETLNKISQTDLLLGRSRIYRRSEKLLGVGTGLQRFSPV